jgi:hypothetical protein
MPRYQGIAFSKKNEGVAVVPGLNLQNRRGRQVFQENSALNLRLQNIAIHFIAKV